MKITKNMPPFPFLLFVLHSLSKRTNRVDRCAVEHEHFEYHIAASDFTQVKEERVSSSCFYQTGATVSPVRSMEHSAPFPKAKHCWLRNTAGTLDANWNVLRLSGDRQRGKGWGKDKEQPCHDLRWRDKHGTLVIQAMSLPRCTVL